MISKLNNVSKEAVEHATGKNWDQWVALLDQNGFQQKPHKEIADWLVSSHHIKSSWWAQMVTVGYEYTKKRRVVGQTKDAGFQVGVQKMIPVSKKRLWQILNSKQGKKSWSNGAKIEIRSFEEEKKLRMRWNPEGQKHSTTLQITLSCPRNAKNKTNVRFHHEKLLNAKERGKMKEHWEAVLNELLLIASTAKTIDKNH